MIFMTMECDNKYITYQRNNYSTAVNRKAKAGTWQHNYNIIQEQYNIDMVFGWYV